GCGAGLLTERECRRLDTTYRIDDTPLDDPGRRWFLERDNPFQTTPAVRSASVSVPARDGIVPQHNEHYGSGLLALRVIVTDHDRFGTPRGWSQVEENLQHLIGVTSDRTRLLTIHRTRGGKQHFNRGRVTNSLNPEFLDQRSTRLVLLLQLPDPLCRENTWATLATPTLSSNELWSSASTTLGGGNAPIRDAVIYAQGAMSRLYAEDVQSGQWIDLRTTSASGQGLRIDVLEMRAWRTTGDPLDPDSTDEVT